ncbi:hypothetical protein [Streptomyces sp. NBC_00233]|uniref:hypothetical protein n=1 Tax=Streptomyces sp. NBC_00233 TaxID=2975686 RepID=UPI00224F1901|nr:hypothetical protein [Streptomyces sp. NBC_00233]MCX5233413.1 hypothetical protein [Streptomyces sp. NBC_00233]
MNYDEDLATALKQVAADLPVGPAPVDRVVRLGQRMRRRRQATLSTALAAAVLIPASAVAAVSLGSSGSGTPTIPAASTAASAQVQVVGSGEKVALSPATTMWLTGQGLNVVAPKSSGTDKPDVMRVADVVPGKVSTTARGDASGVLWSGIYRGPVTATTKVIIKLGARTLQAKVVTLAGKPGWGAYYAFDAKGMADVKPSITVQGADGTILASLTKPAQK